MQIRLFSHSFPDWEVITKTLLCVVALVLIRFRLQDCVSGDAGPGLRLSLRFLGVVLWLVRLFAKAPYRKQEE